MKKVIAKPTVVTKAKVEPAKRKLGASNQPKRKIGRPTDFTAEIGEIICLALAEGKSLRSICEKSSMPDKSTVFRWLYRHAEFRDQYAKAKEAGCYAVEEEALEIADDGRNDWVKTNDPENPGYRLNGEHVQRSRLRIDTRKWFMERIAAKRYGTKVDVNHGVQPDNPLAKLFEQISGTPFRPTGDAEDK